MAAPKVPAPLTQALGNWSAGFSLAKAPPGLADKARIAIIDTVGVILAAVDEEAPRLLRKVLAADGSAPASSVLGASLRTSPEAAAEINGSTAHVLDYDDVSRTGFSHSSAVILPAVLALGEAQRIDGRLLVEAFVVGIEVLARLGMATGLPHYSRGWHSTSTLGTLAAAAACAGILGLDGEGTSRAMGVAYSQTAGTRRNFGTMTKSFHAGHAARCGVHAARLAAAGFEACLDAVEGASGLLDLYGASNTPLEEIIGSLGASYELLTPGLNQKKYPCCYATHRAIDSAIDLTAQHAFSWSEIEHVCVRVPPKGATSLINGMPSSQLMAKFSMQFTVAAALIDREVRMDHFSPTAFRRPDIQGLMHRIEMSENPDLPIFQFPVEQGHVELMVRLTDGRRLSIRTENPRGSPERPMPMADIIAKFTTCAQIALPPLQVKKLATALASLDLAPSLDSICALLRSTDR